MPPLTTALFLIPFGVFAIVYIAYTAFNVYHLLMYGLAGGGLTAFCILYVLASFVLLILGSLAVFSQDWTTPLLAGGALQFSNGLFPNL